MRRREFLAAGAAGLGLAVLGSLQHTSSSALPRFPGRLQPNADGLALPPGFTSRIIAVTGEPVGSTGYRWHPNPDGGATFAQPDGGWIYVSNDEASNNEGGVSMVAFDAAGDIVDAGPILQGTNRNCAGGATPWGTWLSCEEFDGGRVWECDPTGTEPAQVHPAMGTFSHEAAAADPANEIIYLTEDKSDGLLYRFRPTLWGDLKSGSLEALVDDGELRWAAVPDPTASSDPTRNQVAGAVRFNGGEGAWFDSGLLYFTTKGDNRVWTYDAATNALDVIYDIDASPNPVLSGVDNVTVSAAGDVFVCEDGGNMEVVVLRTDGTVEPFLQIDANGSEVTGVAFDPSGTRMYVSSQRNPGMTFEITGPFVPPAPEAAPTVEPPVAARSPRRVRRQLSEPIADGPR